MVSKKYTDDYRTESTIDENGKVIRKAVYIGPYYVHTAPDAAVKLSKRLCLPLCVLLWGSFALCFVQNGTAARQWWASAPYLISLFPLVYVTWSCISLVLSKAPFDRETSDDLSQRFEKMSLAYTILTGAAAAAGAVTCLVLHSFELPGDLLFLLGNGVSALLGLVLYSRRKSFETREISRYSEDFPRLMEAKTAKKSKR